MIEEIWGPNQKPVQLEELRLIVRHWQIRLEKTFPANLVSDLCVSRPRGEKVDFFMFLEVLLTMIFSHGVKGPAEKQNVCFGGAGMF